VSLDKLKETGAVPQCEKKKIARGKKKKREEGSGGRQRRPDKKIRRLIVPVKHCALKARKTEKLKETLSETNNLVCVTKKKGGKKIGLRKHQSTKIGNFPRARTTGVWRSC